MPNAPHHVSLSQISGTTNKLTFQFGAASDEGARSYYEAQWSTNNTQVNGVLTTNVTQSHGNGSNGMRQGYPYELSGSSGWYNGSLPMSTQSGLDLGEGLTYYIQWRHATKSGTSSWAGLGSATVDSSGGSAPNAPNQPTTTDVQDGQVSFSWNSVTNAISYKVYGSTQAGASVQGSLLATQTGTSYTWTGRNANTQYYVAVIATNTAGDSSPSSDRAIKTMVVDPSAPSAAASTPVQNTITWSLVSGATITKVYGGTSSSPTSLIRTDTSSGTSYTHTGLTPGTTYYYRIKQSNQNGYDSGYSSDDSQAATSLTAPTNLSGTPAATDNAVQWTEPTYSTRTYIYWSASSGGTFNEAKDGSNNGYVGDGVTTFNVDDRYEGYQGSGLLTGENDVEFIKLKAYYDGHYSGYSSEFAAYSLPPTPASFAAAQGSAEGEIDLSWSQTVGSGALTLTYTISRATSSGGSFSVIASSISSGTTTYTDTGLDGSTTYYYKIIGVTSAGDSAASSEVNAATQASSGPDPSNEILELGKLNVLVARGNDGDTVSMNDVTGDTNTASLQDFYVGGMTSITPSASQIVNSGFVLITANFENAGERFKTKVASGRFAYSITSGGTLASLGSANGRTIRLTKDAGAGTVTVSCTWTPIYNDHLSATTRTCNVQMINTGGP